MSCNTGKIVELTIPMEPNIELVAAEAASTVAEIMCFSEDAVDEIRMAMVEACLNALEHSKSCDRRVHLIFQMQPDRLVLQVTDHGRGFHPSEVKSPNISQAVRGGNKRGWGLKLIEGLMDDLKIETGAMGTTVIMTKIKSYPED